MSTVPEQPFELLTAIVAKRVRGLRAELGLTQSDLGRALGMSTASVSERLRGDTKFDINELPALSMLLGESIEYLLGLTDDRRARQVSDGLDVLRSRSGDGLDVVRSQAHEGLVRHEGLEPPTRWFDRQDRSLSIVARLLGGSPPRPEPAPEPAAGVAQLLGGSSSPKPQPEPVEDLAVVLPFHRPERASRQSA